MFRIHFWNGHKVYRKLKNITNLTHCGFGVKKGKIDAMWDRYILPFLKNFKPSGLWDISFFSPMHCFINTVITRFTDISRYLMLRGITALYPYEQRYRYDTCPLLRRPLDLVIINMTVYWMVSLRADCLFTCLKAAGTDTDLKCHFDGDGLPLLTG